MRHLRTVLFWVHLTLGLVASATIAITAFTGACMSFEKQWIAWAERDLRSVSPPTPATERLSLDELFRRIQRSQTNAATVRRGELDSPDARPSPAASRARRPTSWSLSSNPNEAIVVTFGRTNVVYANPYTGEIIPQGSPVLRSFFRTMITWHRWLGTGDRENAAEGSRRQGGGPNSGRDENQTTPPTSPSGSARKIASTVVGVSAGILLFLSISGLILWWPRTLSAKAISAITRIQPRLRGRARDWNWHNAIGFWVAPLLMVLSVTGLSMSFREFGNILYGPPQRPASLPTSADTNALSSLPSIRSEPPLSPDAILKTLIQQVPNWETITVRSAQGRSRGMGSGEAGGPQPITALVKSTGFWSTMPRQILLDPTTGTLIEPDLATTPSMRQTLRRWNRSVHTGEAGGIVGQLAAAVGCLGAMMLIYTGFALSLRRLLKRWDSGRTTAHSGQGIVR